MLRLTDQTQTPDWPTQANNDPLLRLEHEMQQPTGPGRARILLHPHELALGGIPVTCSTCRARRDWMLINEGRIVSIRCRCGAEWAEPEIIRADFDAMISESRVATYESVDTASLALGYDGSWVGIYLT